MKQPKLIVITGPSGVGKSFLTSKLIADYPNLFAYAPVVTTRPRRPGENEPDREFISKSQYLKQKVAGDFRLSGDFLGYSYAYKNSYFEGRKTNMITNTWTDFVDNFLEDDKIIVVALQPAENMLAQIKDRVKARPETMDVITDRLRKIDLEYANLNNLRPQIEESGLFIIIDNDETLSKEVIPKILQLV
jgi:guanylate kinase